MGLKPDDADAMTGTARIGCGDYGRVNVGWGLWAWLLSICPAHHPEKGLEATGIDAGLRRGRRLGC